MAYSITFNLSAALARMHSDVEQRIAVAVQHAAAATQAAWQEGVYKAPGIWPAVRDRYASSIKVEFGTDGRSARIYTDDPKAQEIEDGEPARDMKRALDTSIKSRVAKTGKHAGQRYLIIPFRHNTPGHSALAPAMPPDVYAAVSNRKAFKASRVTALGFRDNELGVHNTQTKQLSRVPMRTYQWGDRLRTAGMGLSKKDARRFDGMVAFRTNASGQTQSSSYMTFRVMGEWSSGWVLPAKVPKPIIKNAAAAAQVALEEAVTAVMA